MQWIVLSHQRFGTAMLRAAILVYWTCCLSGQDANRTHFEVESVRLAAPQPAMYANASRRTGGPGTGDPGLLRWTNVPIRDVLMDAYQIKPYQLVGPDWLASTRYDIEAKIPSGATKSDVHTMLQHLLVEHLALSYRHESREVPIFRLQVVASGLKKKAMMPARGETGVPSHAVDSVAAPFPPDGFPVLRGDSPEGIAMRALPGPILRWSAYRQTMAELADQLTTIAERPVVDATGLTDRYYFTLEFAIDRGLVRWPSSPGGLSAEETPDAPGVSLFAALPEQLGLRLVPGKGSTEMLVVERIEKLPSGN